jgi:cyclase
LVKNRGLVKSVRFKQHKYIGDPINAVRIFNELKADELVFLDIDASREQRTISPAFVKDVGEEASMPFGVGGGIRSIRDIAAVVEAGAEKVVIGTAAAEDPNFVNAAFREFGSSTIVVCIDVLNKRFGGRRIKYLNGTLQNKYTPVEFAKIVESLGAGEIIVQSIDRDGTMNGYDIELLSSVSKAVGIPVIALGGAASLSDMAEAYRMGGSSAVAAGSLFVYRDKNRGVLINYPEKSECRALKRSQV